MKPIAFGFLFINFYLTFYIDKWDLMTIDKYGHADGPMDAVKP